ncbi:MAG: hypothetical protein ACLQVG_14330 [Terriglobia bacterium]
MQTGIGLGRGVGGSELDNGFLPVEGKTIRVTPDIQNRAVI